MVGLRDEIQERTHDASATADRVSSQMRELRGQLSGVSEQLRTGAVEFEKIRGSVALLNESLRNEMMLRGLTDKRIEEHERGHRQSIALVVGVVSAAVATVVGALAAWLLR